MGESQSSEMEMAFQMQEEESMEETDQEIWILAQGIHQETEIEEIQEAESESTEEEDKDGGHGDAISSIEDLLSVLKAEAYEEDNDSKGKFFEKGESSKPGKPRISLFNKETQERLQVLASIGVSSDDGITVHRAVYTVKDFENTDVHDIFASVKFIDIDQEPEALAKLKRNVEKNNLVSPHENIMGIDNLFVYERYYCVIFPFMIYGSLRTIISSRYTDGFSEDNIMVALRETLTGLSIIHDNGQVHREISAGHIFLSGIPEIKLSFSATVYEHGDDENQPSSSSTLPMADICNWAAAPEVLNSENNEYTPKADIWLIGITALEMAYGGVWVRDREALDSMVKKINKKKKLPKKVLEETHQKFKKTFSLMKGLFVPSCINLPFKQRAFSKDFEKMVAKCLDFNPENRPTAAELLQSKIFTTVSKDVFDFWHSLKLAS